MNLQGWWGDTNIQSIRVRFLHPNLIFIHFYLPIQSLKRGSEKSPIIWGKLGPLSMHYNSIFDYNKNNDGDDDNKK